MANQNNMSRLCRMYILLLFLTTIQQHSSITAVQLSKRKISPQQHAKKQDTDPEAGPSQHSQAPTETSRNRKQRLSRVRVMNQKGHPGRRET
jgi:hypothetical protein